MSANSSPKEKPRDLSTTVAFRLPSTRKQMLLAIHKERNPAGDFSDTLREAVDRFIEDYLRRDKAA